MMPRTPSRRRRPDAADAARLAALGSRLRKAAHAAPPSPRAGELRAAFLSAVERPATSRHRPVLVSVLVVVVLLLGAGAAVAAPSIGAPGIPSVPSFVTNLFRLLDDDAAPAATPPAEQWRASPASSIRPVEAPIAPDLEPDAPVSSAPPSVPALTDPPAETAPPVDPAESPPSDATLPGTPPPPPHTPDPRAPDPPQPPEPPEPPAP